MLGWNQDIHIRLWYLSARQNCTAHKLCDRVHHILLKKRKKVKQLEISFSYFHIVFCYLLSSFACVHCSGICHCTQIVQVFLIITNKNKKVQQQQRLVFGDAKRWKWGFLAYSVFCCIYWAMSAILLIWCPIKFVCCLCCIFVIVFDFHYICIIFVLYL